MVSMNLSMVALVIVVVIIIIIDNITIFLTKMPSFEYPLNTTVLLKRLQYIVVSSQKRMCL